MFARQAIAAIALFFALVATSVHAETDVAGAPAIMLEASDPLFNGQEQSAAVETAAVKAARAAHPDHELVICLAGCKEGHGSVLWQRARQNASATLDAAIGELEIHHATGRWIASEATRGAGAAASTAHNQPAAGAQEAVVCVAGCNGPIGVVVWRGMRLAWVRDTQINDLINALRRLADRLAERDSAQYAEQVAAAASRTWVDEAAKKDLLAAFGGNALSIAARPAQVPPEASRPRS